MRLRSPSLTLCWCGCNKESQPRGGRRGGRGLSSLELGGPVLATQNSQRGSSRFHIRCSFCLCGLWLPLSLSLLSPSLYTPPPILSHPFHSCFSHTVRWEYLSKAPTSQTSEGYPRRVTPSHLSGPCPSARLDAMKAQVLLQFLRASNG